MGKVKCIVLPEWAADFEEAAKKCGYCYELIDNEMDGMHIVMEHNDYHSVLAAMPQDYPPDVIGAEEWQPVRYDEFGERIDF